jgi:hypothetical protein
MAPNVPGINKQCTIISTSAVAGRSLHSHDVLLQPPHLVAALAAADHRHAAPLPWGGHCRLWLHVQVALRAQLQLA